jgi:hypothetical protein
MKKIRMIGLAVFAVVALSAVTAASALAGPEWLANGAAFAGNKNATTTGSLTLIHLKGTIFEPEVKIECSGTFDGTVEGGASGLGTVTALLSGGVAVSLTNQLACKNVLNCEGTPTAVAENLPWLTSLSLMPGATHEWLVLFSEEITAKPGPPAYEIKCQILGGVHEALCEGETSAWLSLTVGPPVELVGTFNAAELTSEALEGTCTEGTTKVANVAVQEGSGTIALENGEALTVSEGTEEA